MYLTGQPGDVLSLVPSPCGKLQNLSILSLTSQVNVRKRPFLLRSYIMSTYEEFAIIISVAMLIIAILSYTNKK